MNVSLRWLRAIADDIQGSPAELAERLAALGFPVEATHALDEGLAGVRIGRVLEVRPHPNADRLRLCTVDAGTGEPLQVVCGAPVIEEGALYPFAPAGTTLPGGLELRRAKIRGEVSEGMLCSEQELGLGRDASGILRLELPAAPGDSLVEALGLDDQRLEVEVTSNRPDLLSHLGIARELSERGEGGLSLPSIPGEDPSAAARIEATESREAAPEPGPGEADIAIRIEDPDRCPAYLGLVVRGVTVGPSPAWLQTRLRAVGARPINNVVDATNYVLLELGQPLHAFDLARVAGRTIVVRRARQGEPIRTLDGEERTLDPSMLAICDAERPVAVAGVIGGEDSEVDEGTTDVLLECALFTPGPIRATRKALGLSTDASYRFERGVDPEAQRRAILRTARIIEAVAGGRAEPVLHELRPRTFERRSVGLRPARVRALLGVPFEEERLRELLAPLGFVAGTPAGEEGTPERTLPFEVPGFRSWDVSREVDLIEEVARRHGFDAFPDELGPFRPGTVPDDPLFRLQDELRGLLAGRGLLEAHTLAFAPEAEGEVEILNPISVEERFLRRRILPALFRRLEYNLARGNRNVRLFELATVFERGGAGELPREHQHLAIVVHGLREPTHWSSPGVPFDLWDLKGLLEEVAGSLPGGPRSLEAASGMGWGNDPFAPGEALLVRGEGGIEGHGGRVRAELLDLPPWAGGVWAIELRLPADPVGRSVPVHEPLPSHPGVDRDLALLLGRDRRFAEVEALLRREGGEYLREVEVFDLYEGERIPEGLRSLAVRLHFRAGDRSLTDAEVERRMEHLTGLLREELGVDIRGRQG